MSVASQFATRGKKILAIGRNYAAHIAELKNATPSEPFFFLKPTTCYVTDNGSVEQPRGIELHHEVELGVVIGKKGRDINREKAFDYVAGYTISVDYTGRNCTSQFPLKLVAWCTSLTDNVLQIAVQAAVKAKGLPWTSAKGFDTWCSIMTLEEGDLILTGTPEGVSRIVPGDKITAGLEQDGKFLDEISHVIVAREGGYEFKGK